MFRIQYLSKHEKAQVQDFRNWVRNDPESTTRSAPDSPIIGLIENSDTIASQEAGTSGTPNESAPDTEKTSPSTAARGVTLLLMLDLVVERLEGQVNPQFE